MKLENRKANAADEVEVTPEMIEAGTSVLCAMDTSMADESFWAREVFAVMWRALPPAKITN